MTSPAYRKFMSPGHSSRNNFGDSECGHSGAPFLIRISSLTNDGIDSPGYKLPAIVTKMNLVIEHYPVLVTFIIDFDFKFGKETREVVKFDLIFFDFR